MLRLPPELEARAAQSSPPLPAYQRHSACRDTLFQLTPKSLPLGLHLICLSSLGALRARQIDFCVWQGQTAEARQGMARAARGSRESERREILSPARGLNPPGPGRTADRRAARRRRSVAGTASSSRGFRGRDGVGASARRSPISAPGRHGRAGARGA